MVAILYRNREYKNETVIEAISAEDNWKDIIANWLLDDIIKLPLGEYVITQDDAMGLFELDEQDDGTRILILQSFQSLSNTVEGIF